MKRILLLSSILIVSFSIETIGQGCVAIRTNGNTCSMSKAGVSDSWEFNFNQRYYRSYKHFVGTIEQKHRVEAGSQVINKAFSWDLSFTKHFNPRWSLATNVPVLSYDRSSLYEHNGSGRHHTRSFGLGDIRVTAYRWMMDPAKARKGNLQLGMGFKLPTGDYEFEDFFSKSDGTSVLGPVDQSIQLGDGGLGIATEVNGYYNLSHQFGFYGNGYYLLNTREQNGVSTAREGTPSTTALQYHTSTMSVPDQYMIRFGTSYMVNKFTFSGGYRIEGIPSEDLVGGNGGFRRPGYIMSLEPVVAYNAKKITLYASVPWAFERNRVQSYSDKLRTEASGSVVHGDAAFADYTVNVGFTVRF